VKSIGFRVKKKKTLKVNLWNHGWGY